MSQADQRHVQGARNRRGQHGQYVDLLAELLKRSLWRTPKRCSSSTNQQAKVLEFDVMERIR
jgi:hypothetical protein